MWERGEEGERKRIRKDDQKENEKMNQHKLSGVRKTDDSKKSKKRVLKNRPFLRKRSIFWMIFGNCESIGVLVFSVFWTSVSH